MPVQTVTHPGAPFTGSDNGASVETHTMLRRLEHCSHHEGLTQLGCCKYVEGSIYELWTQHTFSERQNHTDGGAGRKAVTSAKATGCRSLKPPCNRKRKSWPQLNHLPFSPYNLLLLFLFFSVLIFVCLPLPESSYYDHSNRSWQPRNDSTPTITHCTVSSTMTSWTNICHITSHFVISAHPLAMLSCLHSTRPTDEQDIKSSFLLPISHCSQGKSKEAVINTPLKALDSITVIDWVVMEYRAQITDNCHQRQAWN